MVTTMRKKFLRYALKGFTGAMALVALLIASFAVFYHHQDGVRENTRHDMQNYPGMSDTEILAYIKNMLYKTQIPDTDLEHFITSKPHQGWLSFLKTSLFDSHKKTAFTGGDTAEERNKKFHRSGVIGEGELRLTNNTLWTHCLFAAQENKENGASSKGIPFVARVSALFPVAGKTSGIYGYAFKFVRGGRTYNLLLSNTTIRLNFGKPDKMFNGMVGTFNSIPEGLSTAFTGDMFQGYMLFKNGSVFTLNPENLNSGCLNEQERKNTTDLDAIIAIAGDAYRDITSGGSTYDFVKTLINYTNNDNEIFFKLYGLDFDDDFKAILNAEPIGNIHLKGQFYASIDGDKILRYGREGSEIASQVSESQILDFLRAKTAWSQAK